MTYLHPKRNTLTLLTGEVIQTRRLKGVTITYLADHVKQEVHLLLSSEADESDTISVGRANIHEAQEALIAFLGRFANEK
jgi:hypothetical protein